MTQSQAAQKARPVTPAQPSGDRHAQTHVSHLFSKQNKLFLLTGLCAIAVVAAKLLSLLPAHSTLVIALYVIGYLAGGYEATLSGLETLREKKLDVDLLMVLAAIAAATLGEWFEGGTLLFLFALSNALQERGLGKARTAIHTLMDFHPETALVLQDDGSEVRRPVEQLVPGDVCVIKPGERIPADGLILEGMSAIDEASLTGESVPVDKGPGDSVYAGSLNQQGALNIRVSKTSDDTVLAKVVRLVEQAQNEPSPTEVKVEKIEQVYAVVVILGTVASVAIHLLLGFILKDAMYRSLTLMVVASPCALAISAPSAMITSLARAARMGVLFKGAAHIENMAEIRTIAFDKTGTLTEGHPVMTHLVHMDVVTSEVKKGYEDETGRSLLMLAASLANRSDHPLSRAIASEATRQQIVLQTPENVTESPGLGVHGFVDGTELHLGSRALAFGGDELPESLKTAEAELLDAGETLVYVRTPSHVILIGLADSIRQEAVGLIERLKRFGINRTVVLTGDHERVARVVAAEVGIGEVRAGLLPDEKVAAIDQLRLDGPVLMVGDGVNDAPALAHATVGMAMGGAGSDLAFETADVVLMQNDLRKLPSILSLGQRTRRVIFQNIALSLIVIGALIVATLTFNIPLAAGVFGHEGSTLVVVANSLRLLRATDR